ncbi:MAG TPA: DUF2141 domain-containing protein [Cyclobacteriaceae bacterium]|nr:DUF2141 domain-containing protein [Cyclobacteriaceae bacterium]HMV09660.1 DUF2141 domain-containing protein [Cyclobacteriaceae bacterium]HMV89435.1 DUF2141 domain-containing protein [Cyclobacteriaceae bacterium]HMX02213.1 DUF2141 domain-containing protein [Cyclobacteriaceae bacterium]HMX51246.1 DUF2141 domain-containing protein [Cyclobacteriaceae bacterium]
MKLLMICLLTALAPSLAAQHKLEVTVKGIQAEKGNVLIALYNSDATFMKKHVASRTVKASGNDVTVVFENLKPGHYAVSTFHDENDNEKLDTNFFGIPKELYGFSNNAKGSLGPPSFDKARVKIEADKKLTIDLR